jgi:DNA-binding IclR family transcriptional regulator
VSIIARAIDISKLLQGFNSGLRVKGIKELTGYYESTIYRILRTLVAFGYVLRDSSGVYRLNRYTPETGTNSTDVETKDSYLCTAD